MSYARFNAITWLKVLKHVVAALLATSAFIASAQIPSDVTSYFPLDPHNYWVYHGTSYIPLDVTTSVNGPSYSGSTIQFHEIISNASGTNAQAENWYFSNDIQGGILLHFQEMLSNDPRFRVVCQGPYSSPLKFIPRDPVMGVTYPSSATMTCKDPTSGQSIQFQIQGTATVLGLEKLNIPLGLFEALRVKQTMQYSFVVQGHQVQYHYDDDSWYGNAIGELKRTSTTKMFLDGRLLTDSPFHNGLTETIMLVDSNLVSDPTQQKDDGDSDCNDCDGINISSGNLFHSEEDIPATADFGVDFHRYYNSRFLSQQGMGLNWRSNYTASLELLSLQGTSKILALRPTGKLYVFTQHGSGWTSDSDVNDTIQVTLNNGQLVQAAYTNANGEIENYDNLGRLVTITNRQGLRKTLTYNDASSRPVTVTDSYGRVLSFTYDALTGNLTDITLPDNSKVSYQYDTSHRLTAITYPGNVTRSYGYSAQTNMPFALTSIQDENGTNIANWGYDELGRVSTSDHGAGIDSVTRLYQRGSTIVTDALQKTRTITTSTILGRAKPVSLSDECNTCGIDAAQYAYDANGNRTSRKDFNGNTTIYTYDTTRNLETRRTEAYGTSNARTISTAWHPNFRLPTRIAAPLQITSFQYDVHGNLLTKTLQATNDIDGSQGLSAVATGTPRTWTYTYNSFGQILSAKGPRTDVNDITTYIYDSQHNLVSVKNALGAITTLSMYDTNGRVGRITDPNGKTTDIKYTIRGKVQDVTVTYGNTVEQTHFERDNTGQVTQITFPDQSSLTYTYDSAHRLVAITDNLNNSVQYTLDAKGNRTSEQVTDQSGMLTRQINRVYDSMNHLLQVTGSAQ